MLLMLFSIVIHFCKCLAEEPGKSNAPLTEQLHKSLHKVNAFLADVQHKIRGQRDALRTFDHEEKSIEQEFFDYTLTSFWWDGSPATGQNTPQTSFLNIPVFLGKQDIPTKKNTYLPEITTKEYTLVPDSTPSKYYPPGYTPSFTFKPHPPDYGLSTYNTRDPGPGQYLGPPGEIPQISPQYSVQELMTLIRTSPTPSTTPDPRPKGPGYYLPPDQGFPNMDIGSTYASPKYPLVPELKPGDLDRKPYIDESEIYPPETPKTENYPIVPEVLFTPEVLPIPSISLPPDLNIPDINPSNYSVTFPTQSDQSTERNTTDPLIPQGHLPSFEHETQPTEQNTNDPYFPEGTSIPPHGMPSLYTSKPAETAFTTLHPNISKHVEEWFKEMPNPEGFLLQHSHTPMASMTTRDETPEDIVYPEYVTDPPQYMSNATIREPTSPNELLVRQGPSSPSPGLDGPTATGIQEGMILENTFGFPYLGTSPSTLESLRTTIVEGRPANIPAGVDFNWATPSTAGDVLHGNVPDPPDPKDSYLDDVYKEMERLDIGYLSVFLLKSTRLVATGKKELTQPVLLHTEFTLTRYFNNARLAFLGQPLLRVTMNLAMAISTNEYDRLQSYASMIHFMLLNRKQTAAVDVNSIMDYADSLYTEEEGEKLIMALKDFEEYPNNTKSSQLVNEAIVDAFMLPYRRLKDSERGQRLIDSVNYALESRFPHLKNVRRLGDKSARKSQGSKPTHTTTKKRRIHITTSHRKKKRRHKSKQSTDSSYKRRHRRNRAIRKLNGHKKHRQSEFNSERMMRRNLYNQYSQEIQSEIQETTTPITTNIQKRFNIITSDHLHYPAPARTSKTTTRNPSYVNLVTRPTTDYKLDLRMFGDSRPGFRAHSNKPEQLIPFERATRPNDEATIFTKRKKRKPTTTKPREKSYKFRKRNAKPKEARTELLRMIVEGSSYSDEEEALKLNLISAMFHGNRTFRRTEINETVSRAFLEEQEAPRAN